jgi:hypothetical protein
LPYIANGKFVISRVRLKKGTTTVYELQNSEHKPGSIVIGYQCVDSGALFLDAKVTYVELQKILGQDKLQFSSKAINSQLLSAGYIFENKSDIKSKFYFRIKIESAAINAYRMTEQFIAVPSKIDLFEDCGIGELSNEQQSQLDLIFNGEGPKAQN